MQTSHLRDALMELKKQLRKHKASHILKTKSKDDEDKPKPKADVDNTDDRPVDKREDPAPSKGEDSGADTLDQETRNKMKNFFTNRNTGAAKDRFVFLDGPKGGKKAPPPAPKAKGKAKA